MSTKMKSNALADAVLAALTALHPRIYRNKSPQTPVSPYVVFYIDSATIVDPSVDCYLRVDIYDKPDVSVRAMETIGDSIVNDFDNKILINGDLNAHIVLEQRQFVSNTDLIEAQMINLRFVVRTYFK